MKNLIFILFTILYACGYPDIDSVPDFNKVELTNQEHIDLCERNNTDTMDLLDCIVKSK